MITFESVNRIVSDLSRCLKSGGLLVIQHSNFRFCDTAAAVAFRPVMSVDNGHFNPYVPLFSPDERWLNVSSYDDVVFEKTSGG